MSDAKFRWFEDMNHDEKMPPLHRWIVGYCGIRYAMESEGLVVKIRQQTVARHLSVDPSTVKRAFRSARMRGWLNKKGEGQRGRGHREADTHVLTRPTEMGGASDTHLMGDTSDTHFDKWGAPESEMGGTSDPWTEKWGAPESEMGGSANVSTSANNGLQGLDTGISKYSRVFGKGSHSSSATPQPDPEAERERQQAALRDTYRQDFEDGPLTRPEPGGRKDPDRLDPEENDGPKVINGRVVTSRDYAKILEAARYLGGVNITADALAESARAVGYDLDIVTAHFVLRDLETSGLAFVARRGSPAGKTAWTLIEAG